MDAVVFDQIKSTLTAVGLAFTAITGAVALFKIQKVHVLVNSEMAKFREALQRLFEAKENEVFRAGQQDVRDSNRSVIQSAATAISAAGTATVEAAKATTAAAEAVQPSAPTP